MRTPMGHDELRPRPPMSSRVWVAAIVASAAFAGFRPGALTQAEGQVPCPPADPGTKTEQQAQAAQATDPAPTDATSQSQPPADCPPAAPPPAPEPDTRPTDPPPAAKPDAPPPALAPAPAPAPTPAPPAPAPAAPAAPTATTPTHSATTTKHNLGTRRITPDVSAPAAGAKEVAKKKAKREKKASDKSKDARKDIAGKGRRGFPEVTVDWTRLDPLALPAFPSEVASTFPGPSFLLPIYQAAAAHYTVPWQVLAAINEIETDFGSNTNVSSAGAIGWMQFMPATWKHWGTDANGDGHKNPYDPVDAIFSAARYLRAAGSLTDLPRAIFAYNHAGWYVEKVSRRATVLGSIPEDVLAALTHRGRRDAKAIKRATGSRGLLDRHAKVKGVGQIMLMTDRRLRRHVLRSKRVHVYECGRQDIRRRVIDRRVLESLMFLAYRDLEPTVTSLRCGHGYYTAGGNVSHHSYGDAVDIAAINGKPILGNQGAGSVTDETIRELLKLGGAMKPDQIISLMKYEGAANTLALADHDDHIHVGFKPRRRIADDLRPEPRRHDHER
jgi:hypothetical protein